MSLRVRVRGPSPAVVVEVDPSLSGGALHRLLLSVQPMAGSFVVGYPPTTIDFHDSKTAGDLLSNGDCIMAQAESTMSRSSPQRGVGEVVKRPRASVTRIHQISPDNDGHSDGAYHIDDDDDDEEEDVPRRSRPKRQRRAKFRGTPRSLQDPHSVLEESLVRDVETRGTSLSHAAGVALDDAYAESLATERLAAALRGVFVVAGAEDGGPTLEVSFQCGGVAHTDHVSDVSRDAVVAWIGVALQPVVSFLKSQGHAPDSWTTTLPLGVAGLPDPSRNVLEGMRLRNVARISPRLFWGIARCGSLQDEVAVFRELYPAFDWSFLRHRTRALSEKAAANLGMAVEPRAVEESRMSVEAFVALMGSADGAKLSDSASLPDAAAVRIDPSLDLATTTVTLDLATRWLGPTLGPVLASLFPGVTLARLEPLLADVDATLEGSDEDDGQSSADESGGSEPSSSPPLAENDGALVCPDIEHGWSYHVCERCLSAVATSLAGPCDQVVSQLMEAAFGETASALEECGVNVVCLGQMMVGQTLRVLRLHRMAASLLAESDGATPETVSDAVRLVLIDQPSPDETAGQVSERLTAALGAVHSHVRWHPATVQALAEA
jgi:hypothetical protein